MHTAGERQAGDASPSVSGHPVVPAAQARSRPTWGQRRQQLLGIALKCGTLVDIVLWLLICYPPSGRVARYRRKKAIKQGASLHLNFR